MIKKSFVARKSKILVWYEIFDPIYIFGRSRQDKSFDGKMSIFHFVEKT